MPRSRYTTTPSPVEGMKRSIAELEGHCRPPGEVSYPKHDYPHQRWRLASPLRTDRSEGDGVTSQEQERLPAEATELEDRVPSLAAGPRTEHQRLMLEQAAELRQRADDYVPGSSGALRERLVEVIENEVPNTYARLASSRVSETLDAWSEEAVVRARDTAHKFFADLMPGATGTTMADEFADKILAAVWMKDA